MTEQCIGIENADMRIIRCHRADQPPPGPGASLADCQRKDCGKQVWLGPDQRQLIPELEAQDLDYVIWCCDCTDANQPAAPMHMHDSGIEADRLRILRGVPPRGQLLVVRFDITSLLLPWD